MAGIPTINLRSLIAGVMTSGGTALPDIAVPIGSQAQADAQFGEGSELSRMFKAFFANNFANEVWALPLAEPRHAASFCGATTWGKIGAQGVFGFKFGLVWLPAAPVPMSAWYRVELMARA